MNELGFEDVLKAHQRIKNHVKNTLLISNQELNQELKAQIFFKMENQQETFSFKARGAFNAILSYQEKYKKFPEKIVAQSSGNHAQAIAFAAKKLKIFALIYMARITSPFKVKATQALGAKVVLCEKRSEANQLAEEKQKEGYFFIHPSDNDDVIAGQGTACLEALQEIGEVDAIFAPCGGGGLIAGCLLAAKGLSEKAQVIGCEPLNANDAKRSIDNKKIFSFQDSPNTIADGARTLAVSQRCFFYLQQLNEIIEISEDEIFSWQKKLSAILQQKIEPTSALAIAGVQAFLQKNSQLQNPKILVIISGGNLAGGNFEV
jgi:threonine dehydratase